MKLKLNSCKIPRLPFGPLDLIPFQPIRMTAIIPFSATILGFWWSHFILVLGLKGLKGELAF